MKASTTIIIVVLVIVAIFGGMFAQSKFSTNDAQEKEQLKDELTQELEAKVDDCPSDKDTVVTLTVNNVANESGVESYDVAGYLFSGTEKVSDITDTTAGTVTIDCGADYELKFVGSNGASGDNAKVVKVMSGEATINAEGNIEFSAVKASQAIVIGMEQRATASVQAYDNVGRGNIYDDGDADATDYETDGVTFMSTSDNTTPMDETKGIDITLDFKSGQVDTNFNDRGILVLVEAPITTWDEPSIEVEGKELTEATALLDANEKKTYNDYEYIYLIDEDVEVKDGKGSIEIRVELDLSSGVASASADPQIDLAVRTNYLSVKDGVTVKTGAVNDASTPSQIIDVFDITFDVTA